VTHRAVNRGGRKILDAFVRKVYGTRRREKNMKMRSKRIEWRANEHDQKNLDTLVRAYVEMKVAEIIRLAIRELARRVTRKAKA
jgi:hypothetical protein